MIIGPESTGKSTLSEALSQALSTPWAPEYARAYLESLNRPYIEHDLLQIAMGQLASEDALAQQATNWLICDTDLQVIRVWSEHKYGRCHSWILEQVAARSYDAYILTDIDLPWQQDPLREHPQPAMRHYFFQLYRELVIDSGWPWVCVRGSENERLTSALNFINRLSDL